MDLQISFYWIEDLQFQVLTVTERISMMLDIFLQSLL